MNDQIDNDEQESVPDAAMRRLKDVRAEILYAEDQLYLLRTEYNHLLKLAVERSE